jgi:NADH dehydrogenase (ubiquinone) Fe-S protein 4
MKRLSVVGRPLYSAAPLCRTAAPLSSHSQARYSSSFQDIASNSANQRPLNTNAAEVRIHMAARGNADEVSDERRASIAAVVGTPVETLKRRVRIYIPARCTMQSGVHAATSWKISFPEEEKNHWANPLMGWTATKDPVSNLHIRFDTKEAAVAYCKQHGTPPPPPFAI